MKKIILLCTFLICVTGGFSFAQETAPSDLRVITQENIEEIFSEIFASDDDTISNKDIVLASNTKDAKKKWQAVFFITSDNAAWDSLNKLTNKLAKEYKKGRLYRAVILYDRKVRKGEGFRENEDGVYLTVVGKKSRGNRRRKTLSYQKSARRWHEDRPAEYFKIDPYMSKHKENISEVLSLLLAHLNKNANTYNYFKIWAHGNGLNMKHYWQNSKGLTITALRNVISKAKIHIDVLELKSCLMGTVSNANILLSSDNVDYLIFASNVAVSYLDDLNDHMTSLFHLSPSEAAEAITNKRVNKNANSTNNALLISRESVKTLNEFHDWLRKDYRKKPLKKLPVANDKSNKKQGNFSADSLLGDWSSERNCSFARMISSDRNECRKKTTAMSLRQSLQKAVKNYRCWDVKSRTLYTNLADVPKNSECMDGMSINKKDLTSIWPY